MRGAQNTTRASKAKGTDGRAQASGPTQPKAKLCKFFLRGHCFRGSECPFTHGKKEDFRQQQNVYRTQMCAQFVKDGTCRHGANCMYAHSQEELQTPPTDPQAAGPMQGADSSDSARTSLASSTREAVEKVTQQRCRRDSSSGEGPQQMMGMPRCHKLSWADCDDSDDSTEDAWSFQADHQASLSSASTPCQSRQNSEALADTAKVGGKALGTNSRYEETLGLRRLPTSASWPGALADEAGDDSEFELVVKNSFLSYVPSNSEKNCAVPPRQRAKSASPLLMRH